MDILLGMKTFIRVAELKSFTRVAEELGTTQSSVSKMMNSLEQHLGLALLVRSTRNIRLTEAGQAYYERCLQIINDIDDAESSLKSGKQQLSGNIRITMPDTLGRKIIAPALFDFLQQHPDIKLDIEFNDYQTDLIRDNFDIAIRSAPAFDELRVTRKLCDIERVIVASPAYLREHGAPKTPAEIVTHSCVLLPASKQGDYWQFKNGDSIVLAEVPSRIRVSSPDMSVVAAAQGFGLVLSPLWLVQSQLESGELQLVLEDTPPVDFEVRAIYPEQRFIATRVRLLSDFLQELLQNCI